MLECPVCDFKTDDDDEYLTHLVEERRKMFLESIGQRYEKLVIIHNTKFPSVQEFIRTWTAENQEQAEGRFKR